MSGIRPTDQTPGADGPTRHSAATEFTGLSSALGDHGLELTKVKLFPKFGKVGIETKNKQTGEQRTLIIQLKKTGKGKYTQQQLHAQLVMNHEVHKLIAEASASNHLIGNRWTRNGNAEQQLQFLNIKATVGDNTVKKVTVKTVWKGQAEKTTRKTELLTGTRQLMNQASKLRADPTVKSVTISPNQKNLIITHRPPDSKEDHYFVVYLPGNSKMRKLAAKPDERFLEQLHGMLKLTQNKQLMVGGVRPTKARDLRLIQWKFGSWSTTDAKGHEVGFTVKNRPVPTPTPAPPAGMQWGRQLAGGEFGEVREAIIVHNRTIVNLGAQGSSATYTDAEIKLLREYATSNPRSLVSLCSQYEGVWPELKELSAALQHSDWAEQLTDQRLWPTFYSAAALARTVDTGQTTPATQWTIRAYADALWELKAQLDHQSSDHPQISAAKALLSKFSTKEKLAEAIAQKQITPTALKNVLNLARHWTQTRRAIKVPRPAPPSKSQVAMRDFQKEVWAHHQLQQSGELQRHPGGRFIVSARYVKTKEGPGALEMPLVRGGNMVPRDGKPRLPAAQTVSVMQKAALGYAAAARAGVVNMDIGPQNILLDSNGDPKLTDWGKVTLAPEDPAYTGTNPVFPLHRTAPEIFYRGVNRKQWKAQGHEAYAGQESASVWMWGATFVEVLNGKPFFKHGLGKEGDRAIMDAVMKKGIHPRLSDNAKSRLKADGYTETGVRQIEALLSNVFAYDFEKRPSFEVIAKRLEYIRTRHGPGANQQ